MEEVDLNSSKFYFGDLAVPPTGETGEVVGIWLKECHDGQERWMYRLRGLTRYSATWWPEEQLKRPSEIKEVEGLEWCQHHQPAADLWQALQEKNNG